MKGKDTIRIQTNLGIKYIRDVFVKALEQNLLCVGHPVEHGYKLTSKIMSALSMIKGKKS